MKTTPLALALVITASVVTAGAHLLVTSPVEISAIWPEAGRMNIVNEAGETKQPQDFDLGKIAFSETLTRPLFSRSRRKFIPPQKPKPAAPTPVQAVQATAQHSQPVAPPPSDLILIGISLRNDQSSALMSKGPGNNVWVSTGDEIAAWKVSEIDANSVRLTHGGRETFLYLYKHQTSGTGNGN